MNNKKIEELKEEFLAIIQNATDGEKIEIINACDEIIYYAKWRGQPLKEKSKTTVTAVPSLY